MDVDSCEEQIIPSAVLKSIKFGILSETEKEKISVLAIDAASEVNAPRLGLPNPTSECSTCGAVNLKQCEGHFGVIKFPFTVLNPYYMSEVVGILNKICPSCKSIKTKLKVKVGSHCKYCSGKSPEWYPPMKFKVSTHDVFQKTAIVAEIKDNKGKKNRSYVEMLPSDYWNFIPQDPQLDENTIKPNKRVLSHAQVHHLLNGIDKQFIKKYIPKVDLIFINSFPVTPNSHRVTEIMQSMSNMPRLIFDERTRAYKKLVDFKGTPNELGARVLDCLKKSKIHSDKSFNEPTNFMHQTKDPNSNMSGLRYMKDVMLGKRTDYSFRMVVVGDPNLKLTEIGIPCFIAETMLISEHLHKWNSEKLNDCCGIRILQKGQIYVRRNDSLVRVRHVKELAKGDVIYRPLNDGDTLLINRPPSIHQHSLIALSVKILPTTSVMSLNPLVCPPFRGDFDGDCLHGYVPQSVDSRVELNEILTLDKQLLNGQTGRNLLSLSHDSLTGLHLLLKDSVFLNVTEIQQLRMFCPNQILPPAIFKCHATNNNSMWTGKQLFSMLLPHDFDFSFPKNDIYICNGEVISSSDASAWLRDSDENLFQSLINHCQGKSLDFLFSAQEVLCEWLNMRGLSVSLSDLYLSSDADSRENLTHEIHCGLQEAKRTCVYKQLMVDSCQDILTGNAEEFEEENLDIEHFCYERQRSAALSQTCVDGFKYVYRDVQNILYKYASEQNSLLAMHKAGSKGSLQKLVEQCMCVGLQYSLTRLSFSMPHELSCTAWNKHRLNFPDKADSVKSFIPSAVLGNSFLTGLNPLETFSHSVTTRDSSFSDNADLPGTLNRRLMYFMRDLYAAYDGTVRNAYGNQLVQFTYGVSDKSSPEIGQSVGALAACAFSEAAYSALDQPISLLETSPLLNLKKVLECGSKKSTCDQTVSLFLSKELRKRRHGFEYAALEVKNYLEGLELATVVSTVDIVYSRLESGKEGTFNPWVCHFHINKEILKKRALTIQSIIDSMYTRVKGNDCFKILNLKIENKNCSANDKLKKGQAFCIRVSIIEDVKNPLQLDTVKIQILPFLMGTVIKGFRDIKKVDILWYDRVKVSNPRFESQGEVYLRVHMLGDHSGKKFWDTLLNCCLRIMDIIDWERSHPDNIRGFCSSYGIGAGWMFFLNNLKSAVSDVGKNILPEHMLLLANCLSATGEFVSLNAKGLGQLRENANVSAPLSQACFSNPSVAFTKAARNEVVDDLRGCIDALAMGMTPSVGTGCHFDIIYAGMGPKLDKPVDVFSLLGSKSSSKKDTKSEEPKCNGVSSIDIKKYGTALRKLLTVNDVHGLADRLRKILRRYQVDQDLDEADQATLMMALHFHPRSAEKFGTGAQSIKVIQHPEHKESKCFSIVRSDGTVEDFSYRKCILGAIEIIAPDKAKTFKSKWSQRSTM
ncbi:hypothetical protein ACFE04_014396 [Oxalis oulophora]